MLGLLLSLGCEFTKHYKFACTLNSILLIFNFSWCYISYYYNQIPICGTQQIKLSYPTFLLLICYFMFKISYCVIKVGNLHIINKLEFRPAKGVFASFLVCIISFTTIATPISQIQAQEIPEKLSGTCKNDQLEVSIKYLTDQKTIFARGEKITIDFEVTNVKHNSCNLLTETNDSVQLLSKESQKISKHTKKTTVEFRTLENGQSTIDLTVYSGKNIENAEILCKSYI